LRGAGPEVLNENIRFADQTLEQLAVARALQIERDAALVAVVGLEVRRIPAALVAAVGIALGALHLDDVGAEIGEHHSGARAGDERALLDHAYSGEDTAEACALLSHGGHGFGVDPGGASPSKPIGRTCSSSRCAMRPAVRARSGTPFSASSG